MENKEILRKLRSVELCMTAHPDCEKGSEFEDRIMDLQEIQKALTLTDVVVAKRTLSNLDEDIKKAKPNMDKIKDVDKHIDSIR